MQIIRQPWHSEKNAEILSALLDLANKEIIRLKKVVSDIEGERALAQQRALNIEESLRVLRKRFFGKKSEKSAGTRERDRLNSDPELLVHSENLLPPAVKKRTRDLETQERIHESSEEELRSMSESLGLKEPSASQWEEISNLFDQSTEIEIIERVYKKILHKRKKYRLKKEFEIPEKEVILTAPSAVKLVPGAGYSIDFAVSVIVDKYLSHIPLERQCRSMGSLGLCGMSTQVLYNLCRISHEHLSEISEKIKAEVISQRLVHSDETKWPVTNGRDSDGYMWIVSNSKGAYYRFEPTRSGKVVKETLEGFSGIVMSDGYAGYYQFRKSQTHVLALCHAHARRYFKDIEDDNPEVKYILDLWEALFKIEHLARSFEELHSLRQDRSQKVIDKMRTWLMEKWPEARGESGLKKAVEYSLNHWVELTEFLKDPIIPLTNNEAERTIRQAVMGRKNFYGSRSIDGADVTATMYTVIESCKRVEIDPRDYLKITLRNLAAGEAALTPFEMARQLRQ